MSDIHGWSHTPNGADGLPAPYEIKVYLDEDHPAAASAPELSEVVVGDRQWVHAMGRDVAGTYLREAEAYVSTSGGVTIQVRNIGPDGTGNVDMLATPITIDDGGFSSFSAATPPEVEIDDSQVQLGDLIVIDIDAVDGTPKGLGVMLQFGPRLSV